MIPRFLFEDNGGTGDSCCKGSQEEEEDEDKEEWSSERKWVWSGTESLRFPGQASGDAEDVTG